MRESEDCHVTVDAFLVIMTNSPRILNRQKRQTRRASAGFTRSRNSSARHPPPELFTSEPSDFRTPPPPFGSAADGQVNKSHVRSPTRSSFLANETTTRSPVKVTNDPLSVAANVLPPRGRLLALALACPPEEHPGEAETPPFDAPEEKSA